MINILRLLRLAFVVLICCIICTLYCFLSILLLPCYYTIPWLYGEFEKVAVRWMNNAVNTIFMIQNTEIYEFGEDIGSILNANCLTLVNHQTTVDVPLIAHVFNTKQLIMHTATWVLDDMFRWLPFGWVSQVRKDIFIIQGKDTRSQQIQFLIDKLKYNFSTLQRKWLIIFPEGGFLYKRIASSKAYAIKNGFPNLDYVTLPRIGAVEAVFDTLARKDYFDESENTKCSSTKDCIVTIKHIPRINKIDYVVDVTIAYENFESPPSFFDIIMGGGPPSRIYLYYRVYDVDKIPRNSTLEIQTWLYKIYSEKNDRLSKYYSTGEFEHLDSDLLEIPKHRLMPSKKPLVISWYSLSFALLSLTLLVFLLFFYLPLLLVTNISNILAW